MGAVFCFESSSIIFSILIVFGNIESLSFDWYNNCCFIVLQYPHRKWNRSKKPPFRLTIFSKFNCIFLTIEKSPSFSCNESRGGLYSIEAMLLRHSSRSIFVRGAQSRLSCNTVNIQMGIYALLVAQNLPSTNSDNIIPALVTALGIDSGPAVKTAQIKMIHSVHFSKKSAVFNFFQHLAIVGDKQGFLV